MTTMTQQVHGQNKDQRRQTLRDRPFNWQRGGLMLYSGKKIRDKKNKYSNSCVVRKKNSERNKKH
jgi:hypothetical protein